MFFLQIVSRFLVSCHLYNSTRFKSHMCKWLLLHFHLDVYTCGRPTPGHQITIISILICFNSFLGALFSCTFACIKSVTEKIMSSIKSKNHIFSCILLKIFCWFPISFRIASKLFFKAYIVQLDPLSMTSKILSCATFPSSY